MDGRDDGPIDAATAVPFWLTPPAYWQPEHLVFSAWFTHAPFGSWLMDALRPRTVVELGSHNGFSLFVMAEAARRLGHPVTISALDTWKGDDHAGFYDEEIYRNVSRIAAADYPDSVRLLRGWFSQSRPRFADRSVDLVHIDGRHGYDDVRTDYEEWVTTVADDGIMIFHDIAEHREGFGVFQLWDELAAQYPSFTFEHGHGLGVLAPRGVPTGPVGELLAADEATAARIRADFERLGAPIAERWADEKELEKLRRTDPEIRGLLETHRARGDRLLAEVHARDDTISALRGSTSWRVTRPLRALGRLRPGRPAD